PAGNASDEVETSEAESEAPTSRPDVRKVKGRTDERPDRAARTAHGAREASAARLRPHPEDGREDAEADLLPPVHARTYAPRAQLLRRARSLEEGGRGPGRRPTEGLARHPRAHPVLAGYR